MINVHVISEYAKNVTVTGHYILTNNLLEELTGSQLHSLILEHSLYTVMCTVMYNTMILGHS